MKTKWLLLTLVFLSVRLAAADAEKPARRTAADRIAAKRESPGATASIGDFERVLTEDQRKKLREYTQAAGEKLRASQQEAMKARRELQDAVLNGQADEAAIRQKSEAIARLDAEVLAGRMNAMAKVAATLTPEQKEKIKGLSDPLRAARPGLGAGPSEGVAPRTPRPPAPKAPGLEPRVLREPAAPPPPEK